MHDETTDYTEINLPKSRPTFLTVLCILTFLVSGYTVITSIIGLFVNKEFDAGQWESLTEQMTEAMSSADEKSAQLVQTFMDALAETTMRASENKTVMSLSSLFIALLSGYGAWLMFQLKRVGFVYYVAAKFAGIVIPLALLGINVLTILVYTIAVLIGGLFILLYSLNRKHMH